MDGQGTRQGHHVQHESCNRTRPCRSHTAAGAVKIAADIKKELPPERVAERALLANGMSSAAAKSLVACLKSGARDAAVTVTRDADDRVEAAMKQLLSTIRS